MRHARAARILAAAALVGSLRMAVAAAPIANIEVALHTPQGTPPATVTERIRAGVEVIAQRILAEKDSEEVAAQREAYGRLVADVAGRVVAGYIVLEAEVTPGATTRIDLTLAPYGKLVEQVETTVDYGSLSPEARAMVAAEPALAGHRAEELLVGLPLGSLDWVGSMAIPILQHEIESRLPEFTAQIVIEPERRTEVRIYLIPRGETVRTTEVEITGEDIPRLFLNGAASRVGDGLEDYVGLPTAYVARHREEIERRLATAAASDGFVRRYDIHPEGRLYPGTGLRYNLTAKTGKWVIGAEAALDLGKEEKNMRLRAQLGRRFTSSDIIYLRTDFFPHAVEWDMYLGYVHRFGPGTRLGWQYELTDRRQELLVEQELGERWYLRWEHDLTNEEDTGAVGYRFRDWLRAEYIVANTEHWLRLTGRL